MEESDHCAQKAQFRVAMAEAFLRPSVDWGRAWLVLGQLNAVYSALTCEGLRFSMDSYVEPAKDLVSDLISDTLELLGFWIRGGVPTLEDVTPDPEALQRAENHFLAHEKGDRDILEEITKSLPPDQKYKIQRKIGVAAEAATQLCLELPNARLDFLEMFFRQADQQLRR